VRRRERLDVEPGVGRRFGLRRHFAVPPWSEAVEVHFTDGLEAYVTPAGERRVGVAFLCEEAARGPYAELLCRFPRLARRLGEAPPDSTPAGMGPLARGARARLAGRIVLLGDAAGYVDALTGEGLSLALEGAVALAGALPTALRDGPPALAGWDRDAARRFARYAAFARLALAIARSPPARRQAIREGARHPRAFARLVGWAVG
jgi:flavin-dependent dehydrogenase